MDKYLLLDWVLSFIIILSFYCYARLHKAYKKLDADNIRLYKLLWKTGADKDNGTIDISKIYVTVDGKERMRLR